MSLMASQAASGLMSGKDWQVKLAAAVAARADRLVTNHPITRTVTQT